MPTTFPARSPIAKLRDKATRVVELAATPLIPEDYFDLINPLASGADLRGRIVSINPETADSATLVIEPGRLWKGHVPGQYVRIGIDIEGVRHWRAYSVTSPPNREDGCLTITVKAIEEGLVSNHLVHRVQTGTLIQLDQATGDFTLGDLPPAKVLFVTAGSGITPVMGMLRSNCMDLVDVILVHSAPTDRDVIFGSELRDLAAGGRIRLVEQHTDRQGFLTPGALAEIVPDLMEREIWACGPTALLDSLEDHLSSTGSLGSLHTERFRPGVVVTGEGGRVTFTESGTIVEADGSTPLLDVGEGAGVLMPSGCRMGICFGCVATLREGAVRDLRNGDVTTSTAGDDLRIQTCVSAAAGTCEIEL